MRKTMEFIIGLVVFLILSMFICGWSNELSEKTSGHHL